MAPQARPGRCDDVLFQPQTLDNVRAHAAVHDATTFLGAAIGRAGNRSHDDGKQTSVAEADGADNRRLNMFSASATTSAAALNYATVFEERVLGVKCDVEVVVELAGGASSVVAGMKQALSGSRACHLSLDTLADLAACLRTIGDQARLLDNLTNGAKAHQLNWSAGGATLIVVKPAEREARFTLTIGLFHREGPLHELPAKEIEQAVATLHGLRQRVLCKLGLAADAAADGDASRAADSAANAAANAAANREADAAAGAAVPPRHA